jgi:nitroreductase
LNVTEAIKARKSIRAFKPTPVPRHVIRHILEVSLRSPSASNSQPWTIVVAAGKPLEEMKAGNLAAAAAGREWKSESPLTNLPSPYVERRAEMAAELLRLKGIAREDKAGRLAFVQKGSRFFDAPVAIILASDQVIVEGRAQFDLGLLAESICLTAVEAGLGTCLALQPLGYPDVIRRATGLPESKKISVAICLGYPDLDDPVNTIVSRRESLDVVSLWVGFESEGCC